MFPKKEAPQPLLRLRRFFLYPYNVLPPFRVGNSNYGKFTVRGRAAGLGCLVAVLTIG